MKVILSEGDLKSLTPDSLEQLSSEDIPWSIYSDSKHC